MFGSVWGCGLGRSKRSSNGFPFCLVVWEMESWLLNSSFICLSLNSRSGYFVLMDASRMLPRQRGLVNIESNTALSA